jgi:alpha-D-ribose 1-methylphosphonate 5-triphosphate synthase subunit PhnG
MFIIFNIAIVGLVLLIAYWWSNEGLFSAVLHMVCVITAGAFALALWEPLTMWIMSGGSFDNYAWGFSLVGVFAITLLALRVASDKIAPANIQFPSWANLAFGGAAGFVSGVLSVGICLIGAGYVQSTNNIMDYRGTARAEAGKEIEKVNAPWLDVTYLTSAFYSKLSVGTLHPDLFGGMPLQQFNPRMDEQATLLRDTVQEGNGQISIMRRDAEVLTFAKSETGLAIVQVKFAPSARDFNKQLVLAKSQVRLVDEVRNGNEPKVYFPDSWKQKVQNATTKDFSEELFVFDGISSYATSIPGQSEIMLTFVFDTRNARLNPKFIQIRGTRFELTKTIELTSADAVAFLTNDDSENQIVDRDVFGNDIQDLVKNTSKLPLRTSVNSLQGSLQVNDLDYLTHGRLIGGNKSNTSRGKTVKGIAAFEGTGIVQLDASPGKAAAFEDLYKTESNASIILVDSQDREYKPFGYYIIQGKKIDMILTPDEPIQSMHGIENFVSKVRPGKDIVFKLLFMVTADVDIREFRIGDITIGRCDVEVEAQRQK